MKRFFSRNIVFLSLVFLSSCFLTKTAIIEIDSIKQAHNALAATDAKTLVIFDCDDTLLVPADGLIQAIRDKEQFVKTEFGKKILTEWAQHVASKQDPTYEKRIGEKISAKAGYKLVEPAMRDEIHALQKRGIKVIALTAQETGNPEDLQHSAANWRFEKLKSIGIDFSSSFQIQEIVFKTLPEFHGSYPVFYRGILCTSLLTREKNVSKGQVLGAFLDYIDFKPDRVIFFDDSKEHIDSVAQEMQKRSIMFCGYVYKAAERLSRAAVPDPKIAMFQLEYLIKHKEWLSDEQAMQMIKESKELHE